LADSSSKQTAQENFGGIVSALLTVGGGLALLFCKPA
jgi:hypothetical protein